MLQVRDDIKHGREREQTCDIQAVDCRAERSIRVREVLGSIIIHQTHLAECLTDDVHVLICE